MLSQSMVFSAWGYEVNLLTTLIFSTLLGLVFLFWRIQRSGKLDFADMITKDGRAVSLTKVLQLLGGITATWIMIKLVQADKMSVEFLMAYLTYIGAVEGYSKFVSAKYGYTERSVKDAKTDDVADPSLRPPKD